MEVNVGTSAYFLDLQTVVFLLLLLLTYGLYRSCHLPASFPEGPKGLPIIGNLLLMAKDPNQVHVTLANLTHSGQFGSIVGLKLGSRPAIVLNSIEAAKATFVKQGDIFSARPKLMFATEAVMNLRGNIRGVFWNEGQRWKCVRKFTTAILNDLGFRKNTMEKAIQQEASLLCDKMLTYLGEPCDPAMLLTMATGNLISSVAFGSRFEYDDPEFRQVLSGVHKVTSSPFLSSPLNFFPVLRFITPDSWFTDTLCCKQNLHTFIRKQVDIHRGTFDKKHIRDLIDLSLSMEHSEAKDKVLMEDIEQVIFELLNAGTETTSLALQWLLLHLIREPEIQAQCQREVDTVIGNGRDPCWADRASMPFLMASLHETLRHSAVVPVAAPHATSQNATVNGYLIPKDTLVLLNQHAVNHDPTKWSGPKNFRPGRWLDANGHFQRLDSFLAFGIGPRLCLGEALAWMELFLFSCILLQRFTFCPEDEDRPPPLEPIVGSTTAPKPYRVIMKLR